MLRLDLDRSGQRTTSDAGFRLHPDGVDGVGSQVADGGQQIVVHHLGVPRRYRHARIGRVKHFVALFGKGEKRHSRG